MISVIVPIYNVERYLERCVESILNQDYKDIEVILVDDGSPDGCPPICDRYLKKDSRVKVIHKENGGLSDARNAGLDLCSGEYISFVDSDDYVESGFLKNLYEVLINTNSDLSSSGVRIVDEDGSVSDESVSGGGTCVRTPFEVFSDDKFFHKVRSVAWNKLYKRELLVNERFPKGRLHEDEFFTYKIISKCEKIAFLDKPLYNYRKREGSIMSSFNPKAMLDALDALLERTEFFRTNYPELYLKEKLNYCLSCANSSADALLYKRKDLIPIIKKRRESIKFTKDEFKSLGLKGKIYVFSSKKTLKLIGLYLKVRRE